MRASYAHHRSPGYFVLGPPFVTACLVRCCQCGYMSVLLYCSQTAWPSSARLFLPPLAIPDFDTLARCFVLLVRRTVYSIYSVLVSFPWFCEHRVQIFTNPYFTTHWLGCAIIFDFLLLLLFVWIRPCTASNSPTQLRFWLDSPGNNLQQLLFRHLSLRIENGRPPTPAAK